MFNGSVYLSGGIQYSDNSGANWRINCSFALEKMGFAPIDIVKFDRMYAKYHGELYLNVENDQDYFQHKINVRKHLIETDLALVEKDSDALIVLFDEGARKGAGTISECQHAFTHNIPIFIVSVYPKLTDIPIWLQGLSTKIFLSFEDLYSYLKQLPPGILRKDIYRNLRSGNYYLCNLCGDIFEKSKQHFVSTVYPLYCKTCVDVVQKTYEELPNRYHFILEQIKGISNVK